MIRIEAPASSANLGPGFDCLGIGLDIYNTYDAELNDTDVLENCEERFNNENNLFLTSYRAGCEAIGVHDHVRVRFDCRIPGTRGMGSSAAFIAAGVSAAGVLHDNALSKEEIFQLISKIEGHPDNTAPCLYGGLIASLSASDGSYIHRRIRTDDSFRYTLLIPDYEISTKEARQALPAFYSRKDTSASVANAILTAEAFRSGDLGLLKEAGRDIIHEPWRAPLIHHYEEMKNITESDTGGKMLISGSGPACLLVSKQYLSADAKQKLSSMEAGLRILETKIAKDGLLVNGEPL